MKAADKGTSGEMVFVHNPENFADAMGDPFMLNIRGKSQPCSPLDACLWLFRLLPAKTYGDSERALDLMAKLRSADNGSVALKRDDFDWMIAQFKETGFKLLNPPDLVVLVRHLTQNAASKPSEALPRKGEEEKEA